MAILSLDLLTIRVNEYLGSTGPNWVIFHSFNVFNDSYWTGVITEQESNATYFRNIEGRGEIITHVGDHIAVPAIPSGGKGSNINHRIANRQIRDSSDCVIVRSLHRERIIAEYDSVNRLFEERDV